MGNRIYLGLIVLLPFFFWSLGGNWTMKAISGNQSLRQSTDVMNRTRFAESLQQSLIILKKNEGKTS
ncbi:MAG: hypothetical protein AAF378_15765, partial [Cyanobacteria bacterium P01_A01_bin.84]